MSTLDNSIIIIYFVLLVAVGLVVSRRGRKSVEGYFLGERSMPWYILGVAGMATFVDLAGTAFQVAFFFLMGAKGFWVGFQGNVALLLAFFMIFMGKWLYRSKVMTNAELISLRFGNDRQGQIARVLTAISILAIIIAFLGYFFVGAVKVLPDYIPFFDNPRHTALFFFALVGIIAVLSGFRGVVFTDLLQSGLMLTLVIYIGIKAFTTGTPEYFSQFAPEGWRDFWPKDGVWQMSLPPGFQHMEPLGILLIFWILANVLQGFGLPFDAWSSQKYYAARSERESSLIAWQWISLFSLRFVLMSGLGILAIGIANKITDPEMALSAVVKELIPAGAKGLLLAALTGAALATTNGFLNSSAAYFVNDIYKPYIKPASSQKHLVRISLLASAALLMAGVLLGWNLQSINKIWGWIIMGLLTGTLPPNIIKWFWWRFNATGYSFGVLGGILAACITQWFFVDEPVHIIFCLVFGIATVTTIAGTFLGKPPDMEVLAAFYRRIRPAGWWGPVQEHVEDNLVAHAKKENRRDMLLMLPAMVWQVSLFYTMSALVFRQWTDFSISLVLVLVTSIILYKYWYLNLPKNELTNESH